MVNGWHWQVSDGVDIQALVDVGSGVESAWVGTRLVSRSGRAGKPQGHAFTLPPLEADEAYRSAPTREARLTFDGARWTLVVDGSVVAPTRAPVVAGWRRRLPGRRLKRAALAFGALAATALFVGAVAPPIAGAIAEASARHAMERAPTKTELATTWRSGDGRLVTHAPDDFAAKIEDGDVTLTRKARDEIVAIASQPTMSGEAGDRMYAAMLVMARRIAGPEAALEGVTPGDGVCHGSAGATASAIVVRRATTRKLRIQACAFIASGRAYTFASTMPDFLAGADEPLLANVLEATEIVTPAAAAVAPPPPAEAPPPQVMPAPVEVTAVVSVGGLYGAPVAWRGVYGPPVMWGGVYPSEAAAYYYPRAYAVGRPADVSASSSPDRERYAHVRLARPNEPW